MISTSTKRSRGEFIATSSCVRCIRPGGWIFCSTIGFFFEKSQNKTLRTNIPSRHSSRDYNSWSRNGGFNHRRTQNYLQLFKIFNFKKSRWTYLSTLWVWNDSFGFSNLGNHLKKFTHWVLAIIELCLLDCFNGSSRTGKVGFCRFIVVLQNISSTYTRMFFQFWHR